MAKKSAKKKNTTSRKKTSAKKKRSSSRKKATAGRKKAAKKKAPKKKAPVKKTGRRRVRAASLASLAKDQSAKLGCCTITSNGNSIQIGGITARECERRAGQYPNGNGSWVPGECLQSEL